MRGRLTLDPLFFKRPAINPLVMSMSLKIAVRRALPRLAPILELFAAVPLPYLFPKPIRPELAHREKNVGVMVTLITIRVRRVNADVGEHALPHKPLAHKDLAVRLGYTRTSNIVSMWVAGMTKIPIAVAPRLARAIGLDPARFTRMVLKEYMPDFLDAIENTLGGFTTTNEAKMLNVIRAVTKDMDPAIATKEQERILRDAAKAMFL